MSASGQKRKQNKEGVAGIANPEQGGRRATWCLLEASSLVSTTRDGSLVRGGCLESYRYRSRRADRGWRGREELGVMLALAGLRLAMSSPSGEDIEADST
jgi:hypothetical protein